MKQILIILIITAIHFRGFSQAILNSNSIITIAENTTFKNQGDILNKGIISNSGNILVSGNWDNSGTYNASTGRVVFEGNTLQRISHNGQSFYSIRVTGANKQLESNLIVENELDLSSGIVSTLNSEVRLLNDVTILNASAESYIEGQVIWEGNGDKFFPIGTNGNYLPARLNNVTGLNPVIAMEVNEPNNSPHWVNGILWVSENRYWQKRQISGTLEHATITLQYVNENSIIVPENVIVAESDIQDQVFHSMGCSNFQGTSVSGTVTSRDYISGSIFTIGELGAIITISNFITPNNDNINDFLYISNVEEYPNNELIILNKIGNKVYSEKDYHNNWNGTVNGKYLPEGSYICIFKISNFPHKFSQIFTILK